jgi:hypothetical protein
MSWRDQIDDNDYQIIKVGTTHRLFPSTVRSALIQGISTILAREMAHEDARIFRNQVSLFSRRAQMGISPYADIIRHLDALIGSAIENIDREMASNRLRRTEDWMDFQANKISIYVRNKFIQHF